jgi:CHAT domain
VQERTYEDFDLLIESTGPGSYRARVVESPVGETRPIPVTIPFSDLELENFVLKVGQPRRRGTRGLETTDVGAVKTFGGRLFDAVFHDQVRMALAGSIDRTESTQEGLRIRLRLADSPELSELPWEYLYDTDARRFLALSEWTPVVRYLDLPGRIRPLAVHPPVRILVMAAGPLDFEPLDVRAEWQKVNDALGDAQRGGRVVLDRVPSGTLADLRRQLRRGEYHVFHFIGHGRYDPQTQDGVLALEGPDGRALPLSGADLGALLRDHRSLRLVVLNSCEGARGGHTDPYSGTAQSLVHQGIPAVVAMQFEITDGAAITFSQNLYEAVADGFPLDAAVAGARNAIRDQSNPLEWATPVLYLRAPDGRIFDVVRDGAAPAPTGPRDEEDRAAVPGPGDRTGPAPVVVPDERPPVAPVEPPVAGGRSRRKAWVLAGAAVAGLAVGALVVAVLRPSAGGGGGGAGDDGPRIPDVVNVNFQSPDAQVPDGYLEDVGEPYGPRRGPAQGEGLTYGWVRESTSDPVDLIGQGRDRDRTDDQRQDTFIHMDGWDPATTTTVRAAWELAVPNDRYAVTVSVGDIALNSVNNVNVEGVTAIREFRGTPDEVFQENTVSVTVVDGRLTVDSIGGENTKINYVVVRRL